MLHSICEIFWLYRAAFLSGAAVTLKIVFFAWTIGIVGGILLGAAGWKFRRTVGVVVSFFSFFLSGVPIIVFLLWLHYPAQSILDIIVDPFYTALLALTAINLFSVSRVVMSHLQEFPQQYLLSAKIYGLGAWQTFAKIQLPILVRQILPAVLLLQVTILHATLFASLISVDELLRVAQRINSHVYKPVEIYSALGIFFVALSLPLTGAATIIKKRYRSSLSES